MAVMEMAPPGPLIHTPKSPFLNTPIFCQKNPHDKERLLLQASSEFFHARVTEKLCLRCFTQPLCGCRPLLPL